MAFSSSPLGAHLFSSKFYSGGREIRLQGWGREKARGLEHLLVTESWEVLKRRGHINRTWGPGRGGPKANPG